MRPLLAALSAGCLLSAGCYDPTPPPPRASVPPPGTFTVVRGDVDKPLPLPQDDSSPNRPPFDDVPLVNQPAPEQGAFVDAYQHVGSPRITLFVNRSLQGQIVPTNIGGPVAGVEHVETTNGPVKIERNTTAVDPWGRPIDQSSRRFESSGPSEVHDRTEVYLAPGEYDEASAKRVDYEAIESVMTDWLAAGGKITMISPRLSEAQINGLRSGDRNVLHELSKDNQVDILIQVQAKPTRQTAQGLGIRLIAEAINTQGGESIGRAFVDVPPPLEKTTINDYTRFLARKLMSDMTLTWHNPRPQPSPPPGSDQSPPAPAPAPMPAPVPAPLRPSTQPLSPPVTTQPIG